MQTSASFEVNQLLMDRRINSQARGDIVRGPEDISTERTGQWVLYLNDQNTVKVGDYRNGASVAQLALGVPAKGVCWNREATHFIVGRFVSGQWHATEFSYPALTQTRDWNLGALGVTSLNSLRYTVNNRFLLVGHSTGSLIVIASSGLVQTIESPLTGDVKQYECLSSMYAIAMRSNTALKLCQINTGRDMVFLDTTVWDELSCFTWNWEVDETTPYPHFLMGNRRGSQWYITPFKMGDFNYYETDQYEIPLPQKPLAIAFSETDNSSGNPKESKYGRAFVVFFPSSYQVFDLLTGELKATFTTTQQTISCGWWKEAQGLYL